MLPSLQLQAGVETFLNRIKGLEGDKTQLEEQLRRTQQAVTCLQVRTRCRGKLSTQPTGQHNLCSRCSTSTAGLYFCQQPLHPCCICMHVCVSRTG